MKALNDRSISVTREELLKISHIVDYGFIRKKINTYLEFLDDEFVLPTSFMADISEEFENCLKSVKQNNLVGEEVNSQLEDELHRLLEEYDKELKLIQKENGILIIHDELIDKLHYISLLDKKLYQLRDYMLAKETIYEDLKYFYPMEAIHEMEREYQEKLSRADIEGLDLLFQKIRSLIANHWKEYITDLKDFDSSKPYNLLCHSTDSSQFKGDFYTRYVSCSLLCEELTETYRSGYGFILSPDNIVLASSTDMYVMNCSDNDQDLLSCTSLKKLASPERTKEEALNHKKENRESQRPDKVYTEIVIDGFQPIGIFCLYDGSKTLNDNFRNALELKKDFPDLDIFCLDIMFQKSEEELEDVKRSLVNRISHAVGVLGVAFDPNDKNFYKDFELFWANYLELIKRDDYSENDILNLYKENLELLSPHLNLEHLFDGTYQEAQIKQILYYNPQIRIIDIINKKTSVSLLENLYNSLVDYKDNSQLENLVPGIKSFLLLYPFVNIDEMSALGLCKCDSIDSLVKYLSEMTYQKDHFSIDRVLGENFTYASFHNLYLYCKKLENAGKLKDSKMKLFIELYSLVSIDNAFLEKLKGIKENDFDSINSLLLELLSQKKESVREKVTRYEKKATALAYEKDNTESNIAEYNKACDCFLCESSYVVAKRDIDAIQTEIEQLKKSIEEMEVSLASFNHNINVNQTRISRFSKHRILNSFRIKGLKEKVEQDQTNSSILETQLSFQKSCLESLLSQLQDVKNKFKKQTGFSIDNYMEELKHSKNVMDNVDVGELRRKLNTVQVTITKVENLLSKYKKEIGYYEELGGYNK